MRQIASDFGRSMRTLAVLLGAACFAFTPARAADKSVEPFPDEWFFSGAQRPAPLKALEGKPAAAISIDSWIGDEVVLEKCRGKVIVVDFWATWCGPCRMIAPILEQLSEEFAGRVKVTKLDVDANQKTSMRFQVRSIPTLLFFKDGKLVDQVIGAVPKQALAAKFEQHAA